MPGLNSCESQPKPIRGVRVFEPVEDKTWFLPCAGRAGLRPALAADTHPSTAAVNDRRSGSSFVRAGEDAALKRRSTRALL